MTPDEQPSGADERHRLDQEGHWQPDQIINHRHCFLSRRVGSERCSLTPDLLLGHRTRIPQTAADSDSRQSLAERKRPEDDCFCLLQG